MKDLLDEVGAKARISELPDETRHYLQHRLRDSLQIILNNLEVKNIETAKDMVFAMSEELRRLGL